ncbi:MAG: helix-turn-helix domain-containing protein [Blastocatellia bacterium]
MVKLLPVAVRFAVKEIAQARGFKNARRLAEAAQVALGTMYGIWDNKKQYVHLRVMERLAATLHVPVGMLLTEQPLDDTMERNTEAGRNTDQSAPLRSRMKTGDPRPPRRFRKPA